MSEVYESAAYEATLGLQRRASDPASSAWVSANAGSGKTHVLTLRVIRLLLAGIPPSKILCLTFTKAAAANMSDRVFRTLARWATLDDDDLSKEIATAGKEEAKPQDLTLARKLFARTIETPGGLKIQTIHAFCERLLHLFPFEANAPAGFRVIEEREAGRLMQSARASLFADAERSKTLAGAIERIARAVGADSFDELLTATLRRREALAAHGDPESYAAALAARLGLDESEDESAVKTRMCGTAGRWRTWARALQEGGKTDQSMAATLSGAAALADLDLALSLVLQVFFTADGKGAPRKSMATKAVAKAHPAIVEELEAERERLTGLRDRLHAAEAVARSRALFEVAEAVRRHYAALKNARGWLDFDDLIARVETLFTKADAAWVLYKLDSGVDHILVDEAQDTSRAQWNILNRLTADFFAGASARQGPRTLFAVGDEKQSIFSFQGAAPDLFHEMRRAFERRHFNAERPFSSVELNLSFRSAQTVLDGVDCVFAVAEVWKGVSEGETLAPRHVARYANMPGLVEIWPPIAPEPEPDPDDWTMPLDAPSRADPALRLADRIADVIRQWTAPDSRERLTDPKTGKKRPIREGDILILVRSRAGLFEALTRSLRRKGVASAGADRVTLADHLAVRDLVAAGRAALSEDDDLALACVLKSPLIGLDDDALMKIAPGRPGSLARALASAPEFAQAHARVSAWRERAGELAPFDFYARLLGVDGGRRALIGRLGREATDAIDEFLARALSFERQEAPSLAGFLAEIEAADSSVKRDMEAAGDAVRVMTVHAAKGLEAPIVFLPDTCTAPSGRHDPKWLKLPERSVGEAPLYAWANKSEDDCGDLTDARIAARAAASGEHRRLLYVAMTRAAERLIVAGFEGAKGRAEDCWYNLARLGLDEHIREAPAWWDPAETIFRLGDGAREEGGNAESLPPTPLVMPDWLYRPAASEITFAPIAPSRVVAGPTTSSGAARLARIEEGRLVHLLMQHLPAITPDERATAARAFLDRQGAVASERRDVLAVRILGLLDRPELAPLFGPGSRAEVPIAGDLALASGRMIPFSARIDRIAVAPGLLYVADFKLSGGPDDVATAGYVTQLALYRAALMPLYPGLAMRAFLVWIEQSNIAEIAAARLDAAYLLWSRGGA